MENKKIIYYEQLDSTNTKLQELAREGALHGTAVSADMQTAGKGRRGRSWESPAGTNIYMSVLLRPSFETGKAPMVTLVMAYSVAKTLHQFGFSDAKIKWPNDIVISGKKVCGILTEMELDGMKISSVIVGVGINANVETFPEELQDKATSLYLEKGEKIERKVLMEALLERFEKDYNRFAKMGDLTFLQEEYNQMLVNCNAEVRVLEPGNEYMARALGINE